MSLLVVGAGAVGGVVGARLAQAGGDVTFLVRPERAARLRERGLRVVVDGAATEVRSKVVTADAITGPVEAVLLAVKASALPVVLDEVTPAVGRGTMILPFLNGMAHIDALTARYPTATLGGVIKVMAQLDDDGDVVVLRPMCDIELGELDGRPSDRTTRLVDQLSVPGISVTASTAIVDRMWAKWVFIAAIGAVTGAMRAPVGDIVAVEGGTAFAEAVLAELTAIADAAGHPVDADNIATTHAILTAPHSPTTASLTRDLLGGRRTEVETVLGDLARRARNLGVPSPLLDVATLALRVHDHALSGQQPRRPVV